MVGQLTSSEIESILSRNYIGHLACTDGNTPYIVPITFYYDAPHNSIIGYTTVGRKIETIRKNPNVCVEVSEIHNLTHWASVIAEGTYQELSGVEAMEAIKLLMHDLANLINAEGQQKVDFISDMARLAEDKERVVYRVYFTDKNGRYEDKDAE
ncbi:MAG: pyridoxamine 5'-phosphate oxidase family protein [Bacteroidia bacterium]